MSDTKTTITIDLTEEMQFAIDANEGPLSKGPHGYHQVFVDAVRLAVADPRSRYVECVVTDEGIATVTADTFLFEDMDRVIGDARKNTVAEFS